MKPRTGNSESTVAVNDLIARLEKATHGDYFLDAALAKLLGWTYEWQHRKPLWRSPDGATHKLPPDFTGSIDAALTLVPEGYASAVGTMAFKDCSKKPWATYWTPQGAPHSNEGDTPAIALCIAALKARASQ